MGKLRGSIRKVSDVAASERAEMFELFRSYYDEVSAESFTNDFVAKDHVIVLTDDGGRVAGFSTLKRVELHVDGRVVHGVFSGDTVVDKRFWGDGTLGLLFLRYLLVERMRHPTRALYWFLISKGFKTYLLMANNFPRYFPSAFEETPPTVRRLIDAFGATLFGDAYLSEKQLIDFATSHGHLKPGVADISEELMRSSPKISFFVERNPSWQRGTELVCAAPLPWSLPASYWWKVRRPKAHQRQKAALHPRGVTS